jgi:glyoxylase I family protein
MSHLPIPNQILPGCGFHHVAIRAWDFDKSVKFYAEGLGFHPKIAWGDAPSRAIMLDTGDGNYLEIFEGNTTEGSKPEGAIIHFALRVHSCDDAVTRALAVGAELTMASKNVDIPTRPTGPTPVRIAFVKGPDGETIEFFENSLT